MYSVRGSRIAVSLALFVVGCGAPPIVIDPASIAESDHDGCGMEALRLGHDCWSALGTRWEIEADRASGATHFEVEVLAAGRLRATDHDAAHPARDEWFQDGATLRMFFADRFVEYRTEITNGTVLVGEAINVAGERWTWRADRAFGEVSCRPDEARFGDACMTVAGTHFRLTRNGSERVIDFLADGVLGISGEDPGSWSQAGATITLHFGEEAQQWELRDADHLALGDSVAERIVSIPPLARP